VAFEALISSVPEQYTHFADDNRFCYNTHYKKKRGVKMIRKSLALFLIALPVLNASASYQIDSSCPQFYFEDERDAPLAFGDEMWYHSWRFT